MSEIKIGDLVRTDTGHFWEVMNMGEISQYGSRKYDLQIVMHNNGELAKKRINRIIYHSDKNSHLERVTKEWVNTQRIGNNNFLNKVDTIAMEN